MSRAEPAHVDGTRRSDPWDQRALQGRTLQGVARRTLDVRIWRASSAVLETLERGVVVEARSLAHGGCLVAGPESHLEPRICGPPLESPRWAHLTLVQQNASCSRPLSR